MALSPWFASTSLTFREAAALLAGLDKTDLDRHDESPDENFIRWMHCIDRAGRSGELVCWQGYGLEDWGDNNLSLAPLEGSIKKSDLLDWLLSLGISREEVPEVISKYPQREKNERDEGSNGSDLHPKRETTYQKVIATLLALQYGNRGIEQPYPLAEELLDECQEQDLAAPASRSTLGDLFKDLPPVQKANLD